MLVKPAPGRAMRDPGTMQLVSEQDGLEIDPTDLFWARALLDGDLVDAAPAPTPAQPAAPAASAQPTTSKPAAPAPSGPAASSSLEGSAA